MEKTETTKKGKSLRGEVVSNKVDKTIVVRVDRFVKHPRYGKFQKLSKRYQVHDPLNKHNVGDKVTIVEGRPISKTKRFVVAA